MVNFAMIIWKVTYNWFVCEEHWGINFCRWHVDFVCIFFNIHSTYFHSSVLKISDFDSSKAYNSQYVNQLKTFAQFLKNSSSQKIQIFGNFSTILYSWYTRARLFPENTSRTSSYRGTHPHPEYFNTKFRNCIQSD